jgi:excisionase family DNA binding protein
MPLDHHNGRLSPVALASAAPELPAPTDERLLTPDDVARQLSVSRSMVYSEIKRGRLRAMYIGRLPRVRAADLAAYLTAAEARR